MIVLVESLRNEPKFGLAAMPSATADIITGSMRRIDKGEEMFNTI